MKQLFTAFVALASLSVATPVSAQWAVQTEVDEFTGQRAQYATATGRGGEGAGPRGSPYVGAQCDSHGPMLYLETRHTFLNLGGHRVTVLLKVDERETRRFGFTAMAEGTGARLRGSLDFDEFWQAVADMKAGRTLKLRVRDHRGVSYDYRFPLAGATAAMRQMGCWDIEQARAEVAAEQARLDRLEAERAEAANEMGHALDAENLSRLEMGDTVTICNKLDDGKVVKGRVGYPDNLNSYTVPHSRSCDATRRARGLVVRMQDDKEGRTWVFVKIFKPYYNAWIEPRHLWTVGELETPRDDRLSHHARVRDEPLSCFRSGPHLGPDARATSAQRRCWPERRV